MTQEYLPAEWHKQLFVQLTWPHADTDWAPVLQDAIDCFCNIAREIAKREHLVVVCQDIEQAKTDMLQHGVDMDNIQFLQCNTNDTWARDHAFISTINGETVNLLDFQFNGWGMKFAANHDNMINKNIYTDILGIYQKSCILATYENHLDFTFEGGSIESDGAGTLMVTSSCLLSENRNDSLTQEVIERRLLKYFNAERVIWINHSWLAGDDTDGHIDTVARFCSPTSIAYIKCEDTSDEHYEELKAMEEELKALRTKDGNPYTLYPLPFPDACYDEDGERLPATHANFLIMNGAVLVPTYNQPEKDAQALAVLQKAFPDREVVGIDCRVLVIQHGSLHCSTMQYPLI